MRTKGLALVVVGLLTMAACTADTDADDDAINNAETDADDDAINDAETDTATEGPEGPVSLRVQISPDQVESHDQFREWASEFSDQYEDFTVEIEYVPWGQLRQTLLTGAMAADLPDVVHASSVQSSLEFYDLGAWLDLSDYVGADWEDEIGFLPGAFDEIGYHGIPTMRVSEGIIYYDLAAFEDAGIEPPPLMEAWTWDEFVEAAQALDTDGQWGFADRLLAGFILQKTAIPYFTTAGTDLFVEENGEWVSGVDTEEGRAAIEFFVDLVREYEVKPEETLGWGFAELLRAWENGQIAMTNAGDWWVPNMPGELGEDWDAMLFPVREGQEPVVTFSQVYWHVTQQSDNPDAAWAWIEFMMEPERSAMFAELDNQSPPATESALAEPFWQEATYVLERASQWAEYGTFMNPHPEYTAVWDSDAGPTLQEAVLGRISVEEAIQIIDAAVSAAAE